MTRAPLFSYTCVMMKVRNMEIFEFHAAYCSVLASPKRLAILACLECKELSVSELAEALDCPLSTVSRNLTVLKGKHLVTSRKEGTKVFYRPTDPRIIKACTKIRTLLIDGLKKRGEVAHELNPDEIIVED